jgi:hypothetical protein
MFRTRSPGVVFNDDIGENKESVSREIDLPEVLRFAHRMTKYK